MGYTNINSKWGDFMYIEKTKSPKILATLIQGTHEKFHKKYPHYFKPYEHNSAIRFFEGVINDERNEFFVLYDLYDGNAMAGFIWTYVDVREETPLTEKTVTLYIKKVVVQPKHLNRGYGKQLIEFVDRLAKIKDCQFIEVEQLYLDDDVVQFLRNRNFSIHKGIVWKEL